jgi:hypothetical protein
VASRATQSRNAHHYEDDGKHSGEGWTPHGDVRVRVRAGKLGMKRPAAACFDAAAGRIRGAHGLAERVFARPPVVVRVEVVGIAWILVKLRLGVTLAGKVLAVEFVRATCAEVLIAWILTPLIIATVSVAMSPTVAIVIRGLGLPNALRAVAARAALDSARAAVTALRRHLTRAPLAGDGNGTSPWPWNHRLPHRRVRRHSEQKSGEHRHGYEDKKSPCSSRSLPDYLVPPSAFVP